MLVDFSVILQVAADVGLEVLGCIEAKPDNRAAGRLKIWQESGNAASMKWMMRDAANLTDPAFLLPEARTVICFAVAYDRRPVPEAKPGYGRVARYAWGQDYHIILKQRIEQFDVKLKEAVGDFKSRIFSDAVPFLERAFAAKAGLGFIGKNTLLIRPKLGSFTLLAEVITDLEINNLPIPQVYGDCGTCRRCLDNCPTSAFDSEYVLNANKCISFLTIEKRGELDVHERKMIGNWIFGCDVCQEVCPFNATELKKQQLPFLDEFGYEFGVGPYLELERACSIKTNQEFKQIFKDSPVLRTKREGLIRNAICVAVNTGFKDLLPLVEKLAKEDNSEVVRNTASWAMSQL